MLAIKNQILIKIDSLFTIIYEFINSTLLKLAYFFINHQSFS